ncbi:MAG TPA: hypothetical protein VFB59_03790 [Candidatus Saccharimonadales bacterium]|nr:hypothetical protein [Candidatus Saccharimonadales bacterium]
MIPLFRSLKQQREQDRQARHYRELIRQEAAIGGKLFGPVPKGGRREFFCLDEHTWVWHEEWSDGKGNHHAMTTRYDVRPHGIYKAQDGQPYRPISPQEAKHLYQAVQLYHQRVGTEIYKAFQ